MDSFVYRWRNQETKQWYIGYHKGTDSDGYICSSQTARPEIESNPHEWTRKILRRGTKREMVALEHRLLKRLRAKTNPNSLNNSNGGMDFTSPGSMEILGWNINKATVDDILQAYKKYIEVKDRTRRVYVEAWLLKKTIAAKAIR